jgi:hypothetical protein
MAATEEIQCRTLAAAAQIREQWADCLAPSDDRRSTTVTVSGDALDRWVDEMGEIARADWGQLTERHGQVDLTVGERERLDFSRTNVPHARACKAIAVTHDVSDWLAHYDHSLTVDEHRDIYDATGGTATRTMRQMPVGGRR